ncbi:MAG: TDP-N-acetylfucosamine:lipid II N-acetylfucosaminyltransferase [Eubacteriales bacterium]|nr:TDP-N-acetylfucosamine:lipid II N-acetylfucosaminyltransferase [Eubacteriales bacterium]
MILHILSQTMYTQDMYMLINTCFDGSDHEFATGHARKKDAWAPIGLNRREGWAKVINPKNLPKYLSVIDKCDAIVMHGLFNFKHFVFISRKKEWLNKTCWVIWGGDIYCHTKESKRIGVKFTEYLKQKYAPDIGYIATLVDKDLPLAKEWYHVRGKCFSLSYPVPLQRPGVMERLMEKGSAKGKDKKTLKILLGNSATETNCHMEALELMTDFAKEDLILHLPLAYGFKNFEEYREQVITKAVEIFGRDKVVPVTESMDGEAYSNFISDMDVAVFFNNRQQAMGNIAIALASGVKLYLRDDTTMWENYEQRGFELENAFDIQKETFDEFRTYSCDKKKKNMGLIQKYTDISLISDKWRCLFDAMEGAADEK